MPKPGRKPLPSAEKKNRGGELTYHRKSNEHEPQPEISDKAPRAPVYLSKIAQREWRRTVKKLHPLGLLTGIDEVALSAYCTCFETWVFATEQIKKHGLLIKAPNTGVPMQSPYLAISNRAMVEMRKWMTEFGMTPSSRSNVQVSEKKKTDPLSEFMARGGKPFSLK